MKTTLENACRKIKEKGLKREVIQKEADTAG